MKVTLSLLTALLALNGLLPAAETRRPNVLVIVSDDQGYADVGFNGCKDIPTPHLDALAMSGLRCTSGYVTHPFCSPTRAALLTGRYQQRFGHENNAVYDPLDAAEVLPLTERLLPQFMKDGGYKTARIGKWHLGSSPAHTPETRGFDETFGFIGGGHRYAGWKTNEHQYTLPLTRNGQPVEVTNHLTTAFGEEASDFVRRHKDEPWFLYLAFNAPHTPHEPTPERLEKFSAITNPARRTTASSGALGAESCTLFATEIGSSFAGKTSPRSFTISPPTSAKPRTSPPRILRSSPTCAAAMKRGGAAWNHA